MLIQFMDHTGNPLVPGLVGWEEIPEIGFEFELGPKSYQIYRRVLVSLTVGKSRPTTQLIVKCYCEPFKFTREPARTAERPPEAKGKEPLAEAKPGKKAETVVA